MKSLPLFHQVAGQPVIVLGEGEAAEAKRRLVERAGGVPVDEAEARRLLRLIDALDDLDDVQAVFSNYDIDDDVMERVLEEV